MRVFYLRTALFCLAVIGSAGTASAQVSRIDGSIADDAQITVVGSGFGTKPNAAKPYAFFDFARNRSTASPYSRTAWGAPAMGVLTTSSPAPNSSASWRFRIGVDDNEVYTGNATGTRFNPKPAGRNLYVFYRMYFNWDGTEAYSRMTNWNMKGFRIWAAGTKAPDIYMPGYTGVNQASGNPVAYAEGTDSGPVYVGDIHGIRKDQWKVEELFLRQSSTAGVADGTFFMASNGRKSASIANLLTKSSAYPNSYEDLFWHQVERLGFSGSENKYFAYDVVYIDDSWARAVVSDRSSWSDATEAKVEIQIPVAWSDNSIQLRLRRGTLDSLDGKYLYVFTSSGSLVSQNGFPLEGGSAVPLAPANVTAN